MEARPISERGASVVIVPPDRDEPYTIAVPAWGYYLGVVALGATAVIVAAAILLTPYLALRLRTAQALEARNIELEAEVARIEDLERNLQEFEDFRLRVLDLMGADVRDAIDARIDQRIRDADAQVAARAEAYGGPKLGRPDPAADRLGTLPSLWPVEGVISREFEVGDDVGAKHFGIDVASTFGAPVRAAGAGTVAFAGQDSVFGRLVVIDHGRGVHSYYGHNSQLSIAAGDHVKRGDTIGQVGSSGESSGPHLHFEVRRNGRPVDPRVYLVN